jgi:hypothetical protein
VRRAGTGAAARRDAIISADYDLTSHATEELAEDGSLLVDVEGAILTGALVKSETDDPRGPRYTIFGLAGGRKTDVGVVGRFTEIGLHLIITVYEV